MLNEILNTAEDIGILEAIGKEKAREFALKVVHVCYGHEWVCLIS